MLVGVLGATLWLRLSVRDIRQYIIELFYNQVYVLGCTYKFSLYAQPHLHYQVI